MFVFGFFIETLAFIINSILTILYWIIIVRALISWVTPDPFNPIVIFLRRITEPILTPIRRLLPMMPIDLSPIIAILGIMFLQGFLVRVLLELARRFQ